MGGSGRRVALLGGVKLTLLQAPFADKSWDIWSHASVPLSRVSRVDRWFDLHPRHCYQETRKCGRLYWDWIRSLTVPIYMQDVDPEIPASVRYPIEAVRAAYPHLPVGSTGAWMVALAIHEGVSAIGIYGIHYQAQSEYFEQRSNFEAWLGIALGRGIEVVSPVGCPVLREPVELYGYETHATPEKYEQRKRIAARYRGIAGPRKSVRTDRLVEAPHTVQQDYAARFAALREQHGTEEYRAVG